MRLAADAGLEQLETVAAGMRGGLLPFSGGVLEQPALLMEAVNVYLMERQSSGG